MVIRIVDVVVPVVGVVEEEAGYEEVEVLGEEVDSVVADDDVLAEVVVETLVDVVETDVVVLTDCDRLT